MGVFRSKQNNKGFSLVELIIVIAIMVALIAVLGPQYVKYIAKSRNAVVTQAAEEVLAMAKAEFASGNLRLADGKDTGKINVTPDSTGVIRVTLEDVEYNDNGRTDFAEVCGVDEQKHVNSHLAYVITISGTNISSHPEEAEFSMDPVDNGG